MTEKIRIGIFDDSPLYAKSLKMTLSEVAQFNVTHIYHTVAQLKEGLKKSAPDVIILYMKNKVMQDIIILYWIWEHFPFIKTIAVASGDIRKSVLKIPAHHVLGSSTELSELHDLIKQVTTTHTDRIRVHKKTKEIVERWQSLTTEERRFMKLYCSDSKIVEIARTLHISTTTVDSYRNRIFEKLQVTSRTDLVIKALQYGVV
jgi:DNA-binding NarL/FixJ family response regulator